MNFSGKWVELEKIILSEVTQTQKVKPKVDISHKVQDNHATIHRLKNTNKEGGFQLGYLKLNQKGKQI